MWVGMVFGEGEEKKYNIVNIKEKLTLIKDSIVLIFNTILKTANKQFILLIASLFHILIYQISSNLIK